MSGLITQSAVLLLARKRLERIERLLAAKVRSAGTVNPTERQVLFLARQALEALRTPPLPDTHGEFVEGSFTPWLAGGISMFATAGAVAFDFPQEAARHALSQEWLFHTLRGGSGDPQRQRMLNGSGRFLMHFAERLRAAILADTSIAENAKPASLAAMRAFAIGQAANLAALLVTPPYLDSIDAQPGRTTAPPRPKPVSQAVRGAIEASVNQTVFMSANPARPFWQQWLPAQDQLPDYLFAAYAGAAEDVYGAGARVPGSKAYNDKLASDLPPPLSARLLRDGYETYRSGVQGRYGWTYGDWLGATIFMFLPSMLMLPFAALLPQARDLRRDPAPPGLDTERAWFELLVFPFAANALAPLIVTLKIMLGSYLGAGRETIFALVNAIIGVVVAIVFFATLGADLPAGVRWPLLFIAPLIADLVLMIYVLTRGGDDQRHRQLAFGTIMRLVLAVLFIVGFLGFTHLAVEGLVDDGFDGGAFWGFTLLWLVMMFGAWLGFTAFLVRSEQGGPAPAPDPLITGQKQWLRLFDDTTLRVEGSAADAALLYAGDREPILKLFWTGAGELFIRPDRNALIFSFSAAGTAPLQVVAAPLAPMTAGDFGQLLAKAVAEPGNVFSGKLRVERFDTTEPFDPPLPTGEVFSDHGDAETTIEAHDAASGSFRKVPADGGGYVLFLAPRARQAVSFGRGGEVLITSDDAAVAAPPGQLLAIPAAGSVQVVGTAGATPTRFLETFQPGDVIEIVSAPPVQARVVVAVLDDQHLTVNLALNSVLANAPYRRRVRDRLQDLAGPGTVSADPAIYRRVIGTGTAFEQMFMAGDVLEIQPGGALPNERRTVLEVLRPAPGAAAALRIDAPFSTALPLTAPPTSLPYSRMGTLAKKGMDFTPQDPTAMFAGTSVLDRAADLATLMSLGVTSHLLPDALAAAVPGATEDAHPAVSKARQVFRDWNLNHRRVNEWRMLVEGEAFHEPGTNDTANLLGWVPLLNRWLDMAQRPGADSHAPARFRPDSPTNLDLSKALAELLGLPTPV